MRGFVVKLIPPRPTLASDMSLEERETIAAHVRYWTTLSTAGHVVAFGPVDDPGGVYGIAIILAASLAEAEDLTNRDPAVVSSHGFRTEIAPMPRLITPAATYDAVS